MAIYNARLFNEPRLRAIVEIADDIANNANEIGDALADYEAANNLPSNEQTEAREDARERAWVLIGEILGDAAKLAAARDTIAAGDD